jgi:hypothetical protein
MPSAPVPSPTFWETRRRTQAEAADSLSRCLIARASATLMARRTAWRPTMSSLDPIPTALSDQLPLLGPHRR